MAGWLPLAISKECGCDSRSLHDGWEMTAWLAPTSSKYVGCSCRSPRDGWEMAVWFALAISSDFGWHVGSLKMAGKIHVVFEHSIPNKTISTTQNHTVQITTRTKRPGISQGPASNTYCSPILIHNKYSNTYSLVFGPQAIPIAHQYLVLTNTYCSPIPIAHQYLRAQRAFIHLLVFQWFG